jgi:nicotinamidase/pyrazinamidase
MSEIAGAAGSWFINRQTDALIIVDLQNDFMPGGALGVPDGDKIIKPIADIMHLFDVIVATMDWHPKNHISFASTHNLPVFSTIPLYSSTQTLWPDHCVKGMPGSFLHKDLPKDRISKILKKGMNVSVDSYSAFLENVGPYGYRAQTGLMQYLHSLFIQRVFICGLARDFCVMHTALDAARDCGYSTVLIDDLTKSVYPENHDGITAIITKDDLVRITTSDLLKAA